MEGVGNSVHGIGFGHVRSFCIHTYNAIYLREDQSIELQPWSAGGHHSHFAIGNVGGRRSRVTVTVTASNGKTTTLTGTTGSNGTTSLSYKIWKRAAAGTYNAQATTATAGNTASVMASATFSVQ